MGRRAVAVDLQAEDRPVLRGLGAETQTAQALAMRARIVLKAADGMSATSTALEMKVCLQTVGKWRQRYLKRLDGLLDEPRPGTPRKLSDADVERVLTLTLESRQKDATHWSTRSWPRPRASTGPRSAASGAPFRWPRIAPRHSSCPKTHCSSTRCATSWAFIWTLRTAHWCCAWMKRARSKHWTVPLRFCPCARPDRTPHPRLCASRHHHLFAALDAKTGKMIGQTSSTATVP